MKQVVCTAPFTVEVRDVPKPEIERDGDVIIKVSTAGLCGASEPPLLLLSSPA